ncbi:hypothetical protein C8256_24235 [Kluyvera genomosp. 2]|uniref:Uncharacterized protein n=1 Tax=Kluyvera genomosp. 2 TaxID=2774054 RepID=A0A2T2XVG2_9ENTR|nr:hypothetical protein C8256_24235 [Kluyvera genomosp. 2]
MVVLVGLANDQIAQSGLSSLSVIYYSAQLFSSGDAAIPDSVRRVKYLAYNCTSQEQAIKGELNLKYSLGYNSTVNQTMSSKTKAGISFPLGGSGISIGFDNSLETNLNGTLSVNKFREENDTEKIDQTINPMKSRLFILQRTLNSGYYNFSGKVLADAVLNPPGRFSNLLSETLFNPVNKDPKLRTFDINGTVWDVSSSVSKIYYWIDSDISASECDSLKKTYTLPAGFFSVKDSESQSITLPIINGNAIKTADVEGEIEVRAKSTASEACKVDIVTIDNKITIDAPLNKWSEWTTFMTHNGRSTYSLQSIVYDSNNCLGHVISQVRYQGDY